VRVRIYIYITLNLIAFVTKKFFFGGGGDFLLGYKIPDAVDTVVCAPDDGWCYHPKHVEQFLDKVNCVTVHLVGYILEYNYHS